MPVITTKTVPFNKVEMEVSQKPVNKYCRTISSVTCCVFTVNDNDQGDCDHNNLKCITEAKLT